MSTLTIQLDDEAARMVAEAAQLANQSQENWLRESIHQAAVRTVNSRQPTTRRVSPLHPGAMQPAADFNAPLEEFSPHV